MKTIGKLVLIIFIIYCFCPQIVIGGYNIVKNELSNIHIEFKIKTKNKEINYMKNSNNGLNLPKSVDNKDVGLILPNTNNLIIK